MTIFFIDQKKKSREAVGKLRLMRTGLAGIELSINYTYSVCLNWNVFLLPSCPGCIPHRCKIVEKVHLTSKLLWWTCSLCIFSANTKRCVVLSRLICMQVNIFCSRYYYKCEDVNLALCCIDTGRVSGVLGPTDEHSKSGSSQSEGGNSFTQMCPQVRR